ncbi:2-aminoethylphosphonate aminotransferase [Bacillus sp. CGMCC 1.16607]|uniref:2-aminoethylphosphonate aminotransferase n=1 Tax=Bacillus sp. CGMCC 1.16607 TaxID=3351842 RepID=UPI0036374CDA
MINTAVILAAGLGSRIRSRVGERPKGFLKLDEVSIIEMSIKKLIEIGITRIVIGTGYAKEDYENLAMHYPQIHCIYNSNYATTGSLYTLYTLKDIITSDFLLLESDLIYEKKALKVVVEHNCPNVILASKLTNSGDEVYIEVDNQNYLVQMSKKREKLQDIYAELVGITKLSLSSYQKLCSCIEDQNWDYETGLVQISSEINLYVHKVNDLVWCEVDDESHWKRAVQFVYPIIKAREVIPLPVKRNILLNPGPATTTDTVKYAQVVPDICPREKEFGQLMKSISAELTEFVANNDEYVSVLFGGSGTAAVESILSSVVAHGAIIIINNGAYGERMCQIAEIYGINYLRYESPHDEAINLQNLETFIQKAHQPISHLAVVHCETTSGLLNDISAIGELCKNNNLAMIVDAMSSYAAIPIDMNSMNISYLVASSNKNLQGMAGVSFVIADKTEIEKTKTIKPRNLYLHLFEQYRYFIETNQMRFTPPVQTLYALKQAILETKWEGIQNRYVRYSQSWETLIHGINRLGLAHLIHPKDHSKIITTIIEPSHPNYQFNKMHDFFYKNGFTIYPGKLEKKNTFRVANIGDLTHLDMERFISLLEQYLDSL